MKKKSDNTFWTGYVDLMTNLFAIVLVLFIVSFVWYTRTQDELERVQDELEKAEKIIKTLPGNSKSSKELLELIQKHQWVTEFFAAQSELNNKYFRYNPEYQRFECSVDVQFIPEDPTLQPKYHQDLIAAGKELESIIQKFTKQTSVEFKLAIDGRAAKPYGQNIAQDSYTWRYAENLSYKRAQNLYHLWQANGILTHLDKNTEIFISGSGFGGKGRYSNEDKNKTFIIQIIPNLK